MIILKAFTKTRRIVSKKSETFSKKWETLKKNSEIILEKSETLVTTKEEATDATRNIRRNVCKLLKEIKH